MIFLKLMARYFHKHKLIPYLNFNAPVVYIFPDASQRGKNIKVSFDLFKRSGIKKTW